MIERGAGASRRGGARCRRLQFIVKNGFTTEEEKAAIETVFFGLNEDVNEMVEVLLEKQDAASEVPAPPKTDGEEEIDLETAD